MNEIVVMEIADIVIGERFRKEMGDLESLAASIAQLGQLQPVGVTLENRLVFGERRIRALQHLGQTTVLACIVNIESLLAAEFAENEYRLAFTLTEREAIAQALEAEIGRRQGQRTDLSLPGNCAEVPKGQETREYVAKKAGFTNATERERVQQVVESGVPELASAMDAGEVVVSAAADIAMLSPEQQQQAVAGGKLAMKAAARQVREQKKAVAPVRRAAKKAQARPAEEEANWPFLPPLEQVAALKQENADLRARLAEKDDCIVELEADLKQARDMVAKLTADNEALVKAAEHDAVVNADDVL